MTSSPTHHPLLPLLLQALSTQRSITFVLADLGPHAGLAHLDRGTVYLNSQNSLGEMAATVAHELLHLTCPDCPEDEVEAQTAELLIPLPDAIAAKATGDLAAVADRLGVDVALVRARLRGMASMEVVDGVG